MLHEHEHEHIRMKPSKAASFAVSVNKVIEVVGVCLILAMMLHVTWNAVSRTAGFGPVQNTFEMVQYVYLPIVALLGFTTAQHHRDHIRAELLFPFLPERGLRYLLAAMWALSAAVAAGFAWFGLEKALYAQSIGMTAGISELISWPVYYVVPIVFIILTVQFIASASQSVRGKGLSKTPTSEESAMHGEMSA